MVATDATPFGDLVRRYRRAAGLTQEELAERAGLSVRSISDIERGVKHTPRRETVALLADALRLEEAERTAFRHAARRLTEAEPAEGEEGEPTSELLTFLIADVRGYTRFTQERGDEAAARLAEQFACVATEVITAHSGEVTELRGDEALAIFSSARQALHAATDLQRRLTQEVAADSTLPLRVGIGLDAGEAVPVLGGYRGGALNLAARLCSLAGPGDVFASETVLGLARKTEGLVYIDRGAVHLKGLVDPVRVIQIAPEDEVPIDLPPLEQVLISHPHNLPDEATPFIGREREIGEVVRLLQQPKVRLVTLTGPGGTGKTRLALQVASQLLYQFEDGVFFVSLASLADPVLVPSAIAEVLGVKEREGISLTDTLKEHLKSKHLRVVLDNFEQVLEAASLVAELLDPCRSLHVLVTSRIPLHLAREHEYAVPPLPFPDPHHLPALGPLTQYDAVALFIERAQAAKASFVLTEENAPAVAEICSRLEGLPLAIVLAAARIKLFPPHGLLQRLSSRLHLLTGGARNLPARQQALRAIIDWSYRLLSPGEQQLFARLSVFAGGCSLEAAEAVCNHEGDLEVDVLEGVASLVEKSLVQQQGEEDARFSMLETIREYAEEKLAANREASRLKDHHGRYYLTLAQEASVELEGPSRAEWLDRLAAEHDNLRAALQRAMEHADLELGLTLAVAVAGFWEARGHLSEGRRWLQELLTLEGIADLPALRAAGLKGAGQPAHAQGDLTAAVAMLEESLELWYQVGNKRAMVDVLGQLRLVMTSLGHRERIGALVTEQLRLARELGDKGLIAWTLMPHPMEREVTKGEAEEALRLFREVGDTKGIAAALGALVTAAQRDGDLEGARGFFQESLVLLRQAGDQGDISRQLFFRAIQAAWELADYPLGIALMEESVAVDVARGDQLQAAHHRCMVAGLLREYGEYQRATDLLVESLAMFQEAEDRMGIADALLKLGDVARDQGDVDRVIVFCEDSLARFRYLRAPAFIGWSLNNLGFAAWSQGDYQRGEALIREGIKQLRSTPMGSSAESLANLGWMFLDQAVYGKAREAFAEAFSVVSREGVASYWPEVLDGPAAAAIGEGQAERATRLFGAAERLREVIGTPIRPVFRPLYDRHVVATREALGEEQFAEIWQEGRAMTVEQAIAHTLKEDADRESDHP